VPPGANGTTKMINESTAVKDAKGDALCTARSLALQVRAYFTLPRHACAERHLMDDAAELLAQFAVLGAVADGDLTIPE
jgi:hypothetical protein